MSVVTGLVPARRVAVWSDTWLPTPLTFIRDQVSSLSWWTPVRVGLYRSAEPMVEPDFAPFSETLAGRIARQSTGRRRLSGGLRPLLGGPGGVDLVHAHFGSGGMNCLPFVERSDVPFVVTAHGQDVTAAPFATGVAGARYRRRLQAVFDRAQCVVAVSDFIGDQLLALGVDPGKIVRHYIGIALDDAARTGELHADREGILFVGRLVQKKGVADLLHAVALLPAALRSTPVTVVGYGPLRDELRELAARLNVSAHFAGRMDSAGVRMAMRRAALFCGPSQTASDGDAEGFGMVFVEAAAQGCPVVAYEHGGVQESVLNGETGTLVPEGDVPALSAALASLLADPITAAKLGDSGRRRVLAEFDITQQTAELEMIYDQVADHRRVRV